MEFRPRRVFAFVGVATVMAIVLGIALDGVSRDVRLAIAIAVMAGHVLAYVLLGATLVRAFRGAYGEDDEAKKRVVGGRAMKVVPLMLVTPLLVAAAHPWELIVSYIAGLSVAFLTHFLFTQVMIIGGAIAQARRRKANRAQAS
jgi:hypothetical protein